MEKIAESETKRILEALLLVSEKPLLIDQAREVLGPGHEPPEIRRLLLSLSSQYAQENRGVRILEVAEGFQLVTDPALAPFVSKLTAKIRTVRLTRPSLETLAIIAYRQPLTRVEIEQIRGVDATGVLETLLKVGFIRVVGRKEAVGRPILYGTTREFMEHFGLRSLKDLPSLEELKGVNDAQPVAPAN
jgi:segregation and condensation protein B